MLTQAFGENISRQGAKSQRKRSSEGKPYDFLCVSAALPEILFPQCSRKLSGKTSRAKTQSRKGNAVLKASLMIFFASLRLCVRSSSPQCSRKLSGRTHLAPRRKV